MAAARSVHNAADPTGDGWVSRMDPVQDCGMGPDDPIPYGWACFAPGRVPILVLASDADWYDGYAAGSPHSAYGHNAMDLTTAMTAAGAYFMSMELIRGVDFDTVIYSKQGLLKPAEISAVLCQALEGLHFAHELRGDDGATLGLVHRDLSPHNLVCGFDGRVKVLDFGVAKMKDQRTVTLPGIVKGKPLYMSPEQATAEHIDRRSDLFSVGLILYEALLGKRAFDKGDDTATMEAIVNDELPRPSGLPAPLWNVMSKALAKNPNDRYRNALELAAALREAVPPIPPHELGAMLQHRFPRRVTEVQGWEREKPLDS